MAEKIWKIYIFLPHTEEKHRSDICLTSALLTTGFLLILNDSVAE